MLELWPWIALGVLVISIAANLYQGWALRQKPAPPPRSDYNAEAILSDLLSNSGAALVEIRRISPVDVFVRRNK